MIIHRHQCRSTLPHWHIRRHSFSSVIIKMKVSMRRHGPCQPAAPWRAASRISSPRAACLRPASIVGCALSTIGWIRLVAAHIDTKQCRRDNHALCAGIDGDRHDAAATCLRESWRPISASQTIQRDVIARERRVNVNRVAFGEG